MEIFPLNIRRKTKPGELIELSQKDLENLEQYEGELPDKVQIRSLTGSYSGSFVLDSGRVRIMVGEKVDSSSDQELIILQALPEPIERFGRVLEASLELGVDTLIPIETYYRKISKEDPTKLSRMIERSSKRSTEQSMSSSPTDVYELTPLQDIRWNDLTALNKLCLITEPIENTSIRDAISPNSPHLIAIGPPRGWHSSEIELFRKNGFQFVNLKSNILRTDTAGVVVASIIKYIQGEL